MTDIVERLRDEDYVWDRNIATEAADEIERLRRLNDSEDTAYLLGLVNTQIAEIDRLRAVKTPATAKLLNITKAALDNAEAENERLQAALDEIATHAIQQRQNQPSLGRLFRPTEEGSVMNEFKQYRRTQIAEMRPYVVGEVWNSRISVSAADKAAGSPKAGDMIARNPKNLDDQWLVAAQYFSDNFEAVQYFADNFEPAA